MPEHFGGVLWKDVTNLHPLGLAALLILGLAMLLVPRRWAVLPMFIMVCFISSVQKLVVFGLDFNLLRIMVLFGFLRVIYHKEFVGFVWRKIDTVMVAWAVSSTLIYTIQQGSMAALIYRFGQIFDTVGIYFLVRCLVRDWQDLDSLVKGCLIVSISVAIAFIFEYSTRRNIFSVFGGVPEITAIRQGRLRCQGAFPHPILAGCWWASLVPIFVAYWYRSRHERIWVVLGVLSALLIIVMCASSTPVLGVLAGALGLAMFAWRHHMRWIRWAVAASLVALHIVMEAPVWHLISRVGAVGGSTSWHRYNLLNQAINRFGEWWLLGTTSTVHWGWGLQDVTNHYVLEGVRGGVLTLLLFLAIVALAFQNVGRLWRLNAKHRYRLRMSWALGVSVFVHCVCFLGVSYGGQIYMIWFLLLAAIVSLHDASHKAAVAASLSEKRRRTSAVLCRGTVPGSVARPVRE